MNVFRLKYFNLDDLVVMGIALCASLGAIACTSSSGNSGVFGASDDAAYADMSNALGTTEAMPVRGRLVWEDESVDITKATPFGQVSQDEIKDVSADLILVSSDGTRNDLGTVNTNGEGYFETSLVLTDKGLEAGSYTLEVYHDTALAGAGSVRLLAADHSDTVIRSDVDLTYLNTDFMSNTGLLGLMKQDARERDALPAMEAVYHGLRAGTNGGRPMVFLSGSPRFFKRILEGKMQLDQVSQDGLVLKPFKDIVLSNLSDLDVMSVVPELKEQIGYKLLWLLKLRLDVAPTTKEVLMGDDSEADHAIYALYHRFTSGELDNAAFLAELEGLGVTEIWLDQIREVSPLVETQLSGMPAPVQAIYINKTGAAGDHYPIVDWTIAGLTRHHAGAWPLALDLYEEGLLAEAEVQAVRARLEALGDDADTIMTAAADGVTEGFVEQSTADQF